MREKIWGGLILITTSLSISLNIYTLLKMEEKIYILDYEIPAKPITYIEEKNIEEDKKEIKNFVKTEINEVKNLKLGRLDPFEPLIKEEKSKGKETVSEKVFSTSVEVKKEIIKEPPYYLRGILESNRKLAILETKDESKSFVLEEGNKIGEYRLEKINSLERKVTLKDSKGNTFVIKM